MISRILKMKCSWLAPILVLVIPFLTFIQVSNPVISLLLLLMICILPGMAILERFHFSFHSLTTRFFYAILFSVLFLMVVFTFFSVVAHAIGITAPLSTYPVKIICLVALLPITGFLIRRVGDSGHGSSKPFNWSIFLLRIVPILLPFISLICVLRLNSNSDATPTLILLLALLASFLLLTVNPWNSPDTNLQALFIYGISAALVLGSTFRGDGGFWGFDINQEFGSASRVLSQGFWVPPQGSSAYDSMLSITVLPLVLSLFSNFSLTIIFKVFYALVLACIPSVLYVACVRHVSRFSAMVVTGALIIGSISFIPQMTTLNRQVFGFAFFAGILLVLNEDDWSLRRQKTVGLIMASGMAVSHYSTAYLTSTIFAIALGLNLLIFFFSSRLRLKIKRVFSPAFSISLILITVLWNGIITQSLLDSKQVVDKLFSEGFNFLPSQEQSLWNRWFSGTINNSESDNFSPNGIRASIRITNLELNKNLGVTPLPESINYQLQLADVPYPTALFGEKFSATYSNILIFGRTFFQVFALFGLVLLIGKLFAGNRWIRVRQLALDHNLSWNLLGIGLASILIGFLSRISSTLGTFYNPERTAFHIAVVLLIPTAVALEYVLFRKRFIQIFLATPLLFFLMVFLFQATSLGGYVTGSDITRISNLQRNYSPFIISESERRASRWLSENVPITSYLHTDSRGFLALLQNRRRTDFVSLDPVNLLKGSYIYASNSNVVGGVARAQKLLVFPEDYIDQHYEIIYSSSRARIYH